MHLNLNLKGLILTIIKNKGKSYLLEIPEGLKGKSLEIMNKLKKTKKDFVLNLETVFGACDLYEDSMIKSGCDAVIHIGHSEFCKVKKNIIYWPVFYTANKKEIKRFAKDLESCFAKKKITIVGPIQYQKVIEQIIKKVQEKKVVKVIWGKKTQTLSPTQILGCDASSIATIKNEVDAIIYFGDGKFHAEGIKGSNVYSYDFNGKFHKLTQKKSDFSAAYLKGKTIGIFVSSKIGQNKLTIVNKIKNELIKQKKEAIILFGNELNNNKILGLDLDLIINTACPRIADDRINYSKPIINEKEFFEIIKKYC